MKGSHILNYQELPRLRDSVSYLYVEHAVIEKDDHAIVSISAEGRMPIPVSGVTCLLLEPGTNVTHAAIRIMADSGCMVIWCGEGVGRLKEQPKELEENGYLQKQFRYSLRYIL